MKLHHGHSKTTAAVGQQNAGRFLCFKQIGVEFEHVKDKALFYEDKEIKIDSSCDKGSKRKGFSRVLKSILFRSKSRTKKSENGDGSCSFRFGKRRHEPEPEIGLTNSSSMRSTSSSCSSSSSLSSCLSSHLSESPTISKISSSSNHLSLKPLKQNSLPKQSNIQKIGSLKKQSSGKNQQQQQQQKSVCDSPMMMGVVLVVISLALTIFWGRLWAIGLNAVWLCSIPKQGRSRKTLTALTLTTSLRRSFDCEVSVMEQKRRVVMEGLLDRRHHHHFHHHRHQNFQHQQQPMMMSY